MAVNIARVARGRLNEDIRRAAATGRLHDVAPDLAFEFVLGITVRTMQSATEGGLNRNHAFGSSRSQQRIEAHVRPKVVYRTIRGHKRGKQVLIVILVSPKPAAMR